MDKQHSDHIEDRIRQAAEGITTPVTEEAWQKMELLLDQQEKKKRRGIFWWWYVLMFALVTGSGLWYYYGKQHPAPVNQQQSVARSGNEVGGDNKPSVKPGLDQSSNLSRTQGVNGTVLPHVNNEKPGTIVADNQANSSTRKYTLVAPKQTRGSGNNPRTSSDEQGLTKGSSRKAKKFTSKRARQSDAGQVDLVHAKTGSSKNESGDNNISSTSPPQSLDSQRTPTLETPGFDSTLVKTAEPEKKELPAVDSLTKKAEKRPPKSSVAVNKPGFYLTASFAKDATSIDKISFKTFKPVYGLGIGYRFTNRVSVQTGFYAGGKIYRAGPGDYKLRQGTNVREIIFIDADCYIYEVPLVLHYDVIAKRKYNVYASTGLSTYFFKKENYDFHYLNLTGAYRRMPYNYKNNTDYFSVANFSVGFEYKLLNRLYIQGEPYVKIPLSGLGEGKVKLTSAGFFAGIRYQPFYKKSKK